MLYIFIHFLAIAGALFLVCKYLILIEKILNNVFIHSVKNLFAQEIWILT